MSYASLQRRYDAAEQADGCEDGHVTCERCGGRGVDPAYRYVDPLEDGSCRECSGDGVVPCECRACQRERSQMEAEMDAMDEAELVEQLSEVVYVLAQGVSHDAGVVEKARIGDLGDAVTETVRTSRELADVSLMLWRIASGEAEDIELAEARVLCDEVLRGMRGAA